MSLTLQEAEDQVRVLTRHVGDTTRLTQAALRKHLNAAYKQRRRWLRAGDDPPAPELYLLITDEIDVAQDDDVQLSSVAHDFEAIFRVDYKIGDIWDLVELANPLAYNQHVTGKPTYRREGDFLLFGPDARDTLTVRILYYENPDNLDEEDDVFAVPESLERPVIHEACALVAVSDQDDPAGHLTLLAGALAEAKAELIVSKGRHPQRSGLQKVMGY